MGFMHRHRGLMHRLKRIKVRNTCYTANVLTELSAGSHEETNFRTNGRTVHDKAVVVLVSRPRHKEAEGEDRRLGKDHQQHRQDH